MSGVLMFLIICIIYMYDKCIPIIKNSNIKIFESIISIALIIVCCGIYCNNIFEMKFVYNAYQDRISTIQYFKKNDDNKDKSIDEKMERLKQMRERLAKNMGTSNYYFYLDGNINSKASRGF